MKLTAAWVVIADRFGAYNVTILANFAMVILFYSWLAAKTGTSLIIISILYGIASGGFVSLQAPMITKLADDMRFAGTMVGQVLSTSPHSTLPTLTLPLLFLSIASHPNATRGVFVRCLISW